MPRARWYLARLAAMSPGEILHRLEEARRKSAWRRMDRGWDGFAAIGDGALASLPPMRERLARVPVDDPAHPASESLRALLQDRLRFLGQDWPQPPERAGEAAAPPAASWFRDPVTQRAWPGPERFAFDVDVRSTGTRIGDVKFVWEPNRLQMLHPLAAAIARTDDPVLRHVAIGILRGWAAANPPYRGVNWISGIELALRLVSIALAVWALDPATLAPADRTLIRGLVAAHAKHLAAFRSRFSSANNHLVAEGLGLLVAGLLAPDLPQAASWRGEGRRILETEALRQILPDGVGAEQSPTYQAFTMELIALGARLAEDMAEPFGADMRERLARGADYLSWLADEAGHVPAIGDDDEGRVIAQPPDREPRYVASVAAAVAGLTGRPELAPPARDPHLRDWLFDSPAPAGERRAGGVRANGVRVFSAGGYTVAHERRCGRSVHLVFDHGPLGYLALAAHGHADALAIWLTLDRQPVFIDAGTYLYFSGRDTRTRLRESLLHNTLVVAGASQSRANGGFGWSSRAEARLLGFEPGPPWRSLGAHDGYLRRFGARHVREVRQTREGYALADRLEGAKSPLPVSLRFLCAPELDLGNEDGVVTIRGRHGPLCRVRPPEGFEIRILRGAAGQDGTDVVRSARFGHLEPAVQLVFAGALGSDAAVTAIDIEPCRGVVQATREGVEARWHDA